MSRQPLSAPQADVLRAFAGTIIPASAQHGVPGADDPAILADILASLERDHDDVVAALQRLDGLAGGSYVALDGAQRLAVAHEFRAEGGAPLDRACRLADGVPVEQLGARWSDFMTPWDAPDSLADGILDDETYDWQADIAVIRTSKGRPIVVAEEQVRQAYELVDYLGLAVSPTGTAGLAALLPGSGPGTGVAPGERVAVVFSGVRR